MKKTSLIILLARRLFYQSFDWIGKLFSSKESGVIVVCYHGIGQDGWRFSVEREEFEKQINFLSAHFCPLTASDLRLFLKKKKRISRPGFILTFDDGYREIFWVKDFLKKRGIKPTVFLLAEPSAADRAELATKRDFLKKREILSLIKDGWTVGCHSATHPDFGKLDEESRQKEIAGAKAKLEKQLGIKIDFFAFPKGRYTPAILAAVKRAGFVLGFGMESGLISPRSNPLMIPRIGVDRTHTFPEFRALSSPWVIGAKSYLRKVSEVL